MSNDEDGVPLDELRSFLAEKAKEPVSPKRLSLRQVIEQLHPQLVELRDAGYTDSDIAALLEQKGISIKPGTLRNYMSAAAGAGRPSRKRTPPGTPPASGNTSPGKGAPGAAPAATGSAPPNAPRGARNPRRQL